MMDEVGKGGCVRESAYSKKRWRLFHSMESLVYLPTIPTLEGQRHITEDEELSSIRVVDNYNCFHAQIYESL